MAPKLKLTIRAPDHFLFSEIVAETETNSRSKDLIDVLCSGSILETKDKNTDRNKTRKLSSLSEEGDVKTDDSVPPKERIGK